MQCRDLGESEEESATPFSCYLPLSTQKQKSANSCRVTEFNEQMETDFQGPKTLSPISQKPRALARATIATGAPRLIADERVRHRSKPPPTPPVNHKAIPKVVAFGRTTKLDDTVHAKAGRFPLNRTMSASTLNINQNIPHTLSAQVQTLQQLVDELGKRVSVQDKKIVELKSAVSHLKENQANACKDIVTTTKSLRGLSERCLKNEKDVEDMDKIIRRLTRTVKKDPVSYVKLDGHEEIPVINLQGSAREGREDGPEASFLELEDRVKREEKGMRSGSAGTAHSTREQRFYAQRHYDNSKENQEPHSGRSVTHQAFYYVQREEVLTPSPRPRPTRTSDMSRRYPELPARKEERLTRQKSVHTDKNGSLDYTSAMKRYLDKTLSFNDDDDLDQSLDSYRPTPRKLNGYNDESLDDVDEPKYVSMVANNVDDRRRYKNVAERIAAARYDDGHGESLDSDIPDNFQTYKSRYQR